MLQQTIYETKTGSNFYLIEQALHSIATSIGDTNNHFRTSKQTLIQTPDGYLKHSKQRHLPTYIRIRRFNF